MTPTRLLLGSGPSPVPPRVLDALAQPTLGHLDPAFAAVMDEVSELLRGTFETQNAEISGGLGPLAGRVWRIGVMGEGARPEHQEQLVDVIARRVGGDRRAALETLEAGWTTRT